MSFHRGQQVVRVSGTCERAIPCPPIGEVVTVCNVYVGNMCFCGSCGPEITMIEVVEYPAPEGDGYLAGWVAMHFRPAVTRKTDIAIFEKLLTPVKRKQPVEA